MKKVQELLNPEALSKKYKVDINRILKAWRAGKNDQEIASMLGVTPWRIEQIRRECQQARWKVTLSRVKFRGMQIYRSNTHNDNS